ncbi:MAG TPA: glycosyltransferase, partial [Thermoanaerobaculia bacterium]|nr:glycosyltransferase [Thermoanaerobaculia bacterium]
VLLVAGEVWFGEEDSYRRLAQKEGVAARVRFDLRFVPDAEVAAYFAAADVVVAPYRYENQSGVAMNAFHFRRPVIATNVGGLPDIIEEGVNGKLVPAEDPESLARAIDEFFAGADRKGMEQGAGETAAKYSWERYGSPVAEWIASDQRLGTRDQGHHFPASSL